jgi:hypothetical protein
MEQSTVPSGHRLRFGRRRRQRGRHRLVLRWLPSGRGLPGSIRRLFETIFKQQSDPYLEGHGFVGFGDRATLLFISAHRASVLTDGGDRTKRCLLSTLSGSVETLPKGYPIDPKQLLMWLGRSMKVGTGPVACSTRWLAIQSS